MDSVARVAKFYHIFLLGLSIKLGGCVAAWHNGYVIGVWGYFIACLLVGTGYISLNLSVAEVTSVTSFPGGHFGYIRASIGPFWGYIGGIMGLVESIFFLAVSMLKLGQAMTITLNTPHEFEFIWWTIGYIVMMFFHTKGGITLWNFLTVTTIVTVVTMFAYLIGSIPFLDFPQYAYRNSETGFARDPLDFFLVLRLPCWLFVGIDLLPLASEDVQNATYGIPRAIAAVMAVMFVLSIWLQCCVAGQAPGLVDDFFGLDNVFPLSSGFGHIFGISRRWGTAFCVLPCFGSCLGFMYVAGRQMQAMARSGLLPALFKRTYGKHETPLASMMAVSAVGLVSLAFAWHFDPHTLLFRMAISGSCVAYILMLLCFLQFRTTYSHMVRTFISPLGMLGAVYGIACFAVVELAVLFVLPLRVDFHQTTAFLCICAVAAAHYFLVAQYAQTFSPEEQEKFMRTYIINANNNIRRKKASGIQRARRIPQQTAGMVQTRCIQHGNSSGDVADSGGLQGVVSSSSASAAGASSNYAAVRRPSDVGYPVEGQEDLDCVADFSPGRHFRTVHPAAATLRSGLYSYAQRSSASCGVTTDEDWELGEVAEEELEQVQLARRRAEGDGDWSPLPALHEQQRLFDDDYSPPYFPF